MDIKFPTQEDPFGKTMAKAVICCVIALCLGVFLGNALGAFLGTDESVLTTSAYTDNMSAARTMFTDEDQMNSYMDTAQRVLEMDGLKLYSSRDHQKMLACYQGEYHDAAELLGQDLQPSLIELMNTEDALYGQETAGGAPIEDLRLWNLSVQDGVVYFFLHYDEAGYVGIAYDHNEAVLTQDMDHALPLTAKLEGVQGIWYIIYDMEENQ